MRVRTLHWWNLLLLFCREGQDFTWNQEGLQVAILIRWGQRLHKKNDLRTTRSSPDQSTHDAQILQPFQLHVIPVAIVSGAVAIERYFTCDRCPWRSTKQFCIVSASQLKG